MWTIKQSGQFKRALKREAKGPHRQALQSHFVSIVAALANDHPLAEKHRDHALTGDKAHKLAARLRGVRNLDDLYLSLVSEWRDPATDKRTWLAPVQSLLRRLCAAHTCL